MLLLEEESDPDTKGVEEEEESGDEDHDDGEEADEGDIYNE